MARLRLPLLLLLAAGGTAGWMMRSGDAPAHAASPGEPPLSAKHEARAGSSHQTMAGEWRVLLARCESGDDPAALQSQLLAVKKRWLAEEEPHVVAQVIAQLLRIGADVPTGIPFEAGPGRALRGWPTLRVFLLDHLTLADPDLAMEVAREILATTGSAEEFAVALKPLTLGGPWKASDEELAGHFSKLLGTPEWQRSAGLAEALDLSRVAASPAVTETLARWVDGAPPALKAGSLALHETAASHPGLVSELVTSHPGLLSGHPDLRASLMARADISDAAQAEQVDAYFRDPAIPQEEKQHFLSLFPLRSATTGYRLYGKPPSPFKEAQVRAGDQAALEIVSAWRNDPAFSGFAGDLSRLDSRLQSWTRQAGD